MIADVNNQAALYCALAKAQGEFLPIIKNRTVEISLKTGGKYKFRYADLEEITSKTRPALSKYGLAVSQMLTGSSLTTILMHESGGIIQSVIEIPGANGFSDPKNMGAMISYLRRYAKSAILDVAADDDLDESGQDTDNSAVHRTQTPPARTKPEQLPEYPAEKMAEMLPKWQAAIESSRSNAGDIIAIISTKFTLTEEQRKIIYKLEEGDAV